MSGGAWREVPGESGAAADLAEGALRAVSVDGFGIVISRCDGRPVAVEDRCTHDDGPLGDGRVEGCEVICPRHGARFDLRDGRVTRMPAIAPVRAIPVEERDGRLWVDVEAL